MKRLQSRRFELGTEAIPKLHGVSCSGNFEETAQTSGVKHGMHLGFPSLLLSSVVQGDHPKRRMGKRRTTSILTDLHAVAIRYLGHPA